MKEQYVFLISDTPQQKGFVNFFKSLPEVRGANHIV